MDSKGLKHVKHENYFDISGNLRKKKSLYSKKLVEHWPPRKNITLKNNFTCYRIQLDNPQAKAGLRIYLDIQKIIQFIQGEHNKSLVTHCSPQWRTPLYSVSKKVDTVDNYNGRYDGGLSAINYTIQQR